jgi:hypothetical protein
MPRNAPTAVTAGDAILALRHVVQDHSDARTTIGLPTRIDEVEWVGRLLGWTWPPSYLEVLSKHDGVGVSVADLYSFIQSFQFLMHRRDYWHRPDGFWPVAGDGCGSCWALWFGGQDAQRECPVLFFEKEFSLDEPYQLVAPSYAAFVAGSMRHDCARHRCAGLDTILGRNVSVRSRRFRVR